MTLKLLASGLAAIAFATACSRPPSAVESKTADVPSVAPTACLPQRARAAAYLAANPTWRVSDLADLSRDDRDIWTSRRGSQCPGMSVALIDVGVQATAMLLLTDEGGRLVQKLVIVADDAERPVFEQTFDPQTFRSAMVLWSLPPGDFVDEANGDRISILHESFVLEKIEASSWQYYWNGEEFRRIAASE